MCSAGGTRWLGAAGSDCTAWRRGSAALCPCGSQSPSVFAWSTEPGSGGAAVRLLRSWDSHGAACRAPVQVHGWCPTSGLFYPVCQFKSTAGKLVCSCSGNNLLPEMLAALFLQGDAFHIPSER